MLMDWEKFFSLCNLPEKMVANSIRDSYYLVISSCLSLIKKIKIKATYKLFVVIIIGLYSWECRCPLFPNKHGNKMKFYFPIDNPLSNKHRYRSIKSIYLLSSSSSSPSSGIEFDMSDDDGTCNEFHDNDNHHSSLKLSHESFLFLLKCEKKT